MKFFWVLVFEWIQEKSNNKYKKKTLHKYRPHFYTYAFTHRRENRNTFKSSIGFKICAQLWLSCFKIENTQILHYSFSVKFVWIFFLLFSSNLQWFKWKQCVYNHARLSTSFFEELHLFCPSNRNKQEKIEILKKQRLLLLV